MRNPSIPDRDVLSVASALRRILLSHNLRLYQSRAEDHPGIVVCTFDADFAGQAQGIDQAVAAAHDNVKNQAIRVNQHTQGCTEIVVSSGVCRS